MKKEPQLFIKNEKGRYEPFKRPQETDNKLYRKIAGRYEPTSMLTTNDLTEGVWVVKRKRGSTSFSMSDYLKFNYQLEHVADLQNPLLALPTSQIGFVDKVVEEVYFDHALDTKLEGLAPIEVFKQQVSEIINRITKREQ